MSGASHHQVSPGALVSIILQADQRTGRQVQGTVAEVLTKHGGHAQGIDVLLTDGRVGRVQEVLHDGSGPQHYFTQSTPHNPTVPHPQNWQAQTPTYPSGHPSSHSQQPMMLHSPDPQNWQAHTGHPSGRPHSRTGHSPGPEPPNWQAHTNRPNGRPPSRTGHSPVPDPPNWQAHTSYSTSGRPPSRTGHSPVPDSQSWQAPTNFPSGHSLAYLQPQPQSPHQHDQNQHLHPADSRPPQAYLRVDDAPQIPAEERSEQVEYLQSYEDSKPVTEDDRNQATLQREFPNIDSSLIAAIYGDSKSLRATREMLQELKD